MAERPMEDTEPRVQQLFHGLYSERNIGSQDLASAGFSIYMALIKCNECNEEVSDKASICPHCGNPIHTEPNSIINPSPLPISEINIEEKPGILLKILWSLIFLSAILLFYFLFLKPLIAQSVYPPNTEFNAISRVIQLKNFIWQALMNQPTNLFQKQWWQEFQQIQQTTNKTDSASIVPTKIIFNPKLISDSKFSFYTLNVGKNEDHNISYRDEQGIIKLLNTINYPPKLTQNLIIIFINPDDVTPDMVLEIPNQLRINITGIRTAEGGAYAATNNGWHIIEINKPTSVPESILTHELGHRISDELKSGEWDEYYKLRNIPKGTPWNQNWYLSPGEDFAEVFKYIFRQGDPKTSNEWQIQTHYGILILKNGLYDINAVLSPCSSITDKLRQEYIAKNYLGSDPLAAINNLQKIGKIINESPDPELQKCRNENFLSTDIVGRPYYPYIRIINNATEQFVRGILTRLSQ